MVDPRSTICGRQIPRYPRTTTSIEKAITLGRFDDGDGKALTQDRALWRLEPPCSHMSIAVLRPRPGSSCIFLASPSLTSPIDPPACTSMPSLHWASLHTRAPTHRHPHFSRSPRNASTTSIFFLPPVNLRPAQHIRRHSVH